MHVFVHLNTHTHNRHPSGPYIAGVAARETAQALKTLAQAARGVAASTTDPKAAAAMLDSARNVMEGSALLIHEAKQALISPGDAESQQRLAQVRPARSMWLLFFFQVGVTELIICM